MEELQIFWKVLLSILGGLTAIWGAVKIIKEIKKPSEDLKNEVTGIKQDVSELKKNFQGMEQKMKDYTDGRVAEVEKGIKDQSAQLTRINDCLEGMMESLFAIGNHMISGNDVTKIREANDNLVKKLIKHDS